jgi:hypothetical protein
MPEPSDVLTAQKLVKLAHTAEVVPKAETELSLAEVREKLNAELRDEVYTKSLKVLDAATDAFEVEETTEEPPEEWVEKHGKRESKKRLRIAKEAMKSNKDAPIALKMALTNVATREKAKALEGGIAARTLNVNFINIQAPEFPRQRLEDDE